MRVRLRKEKCVTPLETACLEFFDPIVKHAKVNPCKFTILAMRIGISPNAESAPSNLWDLGLLS